MHIVFTYLNVWAVMEQLHLSLTHSLWNLLLLDSRDSVNPQATRGPRAKLGRPEEADVITRLDPLKYSILSYPTASIINYFALRFLLQPQLTKLSHNQNVRTECRDEQLLPKW